MTDKPKNILWIMCDQLRFDYLGCTGHPTIKTPNIDRLAARGVRFANTYVQSTICGPSRMSAYTGRYMRSHGSTQNGVPLRVGEPTLGDHLRAEGVRTVLIGKTHMRADKRGMERLGIDPTSIIGVQTAECGFEPWERDDGLHPDGPYDANPAYDTYLRQHGFQAENPWEYWANSAESEDGADLNGWLLAHADKPARIPNEHSETPYMTRRAMEFIEAAQATGQPWCAHLSYIKPHWPYIVPAPYHNMYGPEDVLPAVRSETERSNAHPIYAAFQAERYSRNFSREEVRTRVIPAYMGLITQVDDELGKLFAFLDAKGLTDSTVIVFTSDHGDYLGDHWMGEKYLFHDASVKIPLIICDPSPEADATRGTVVTDLVEMIDLAPTFLDVYGARLRTHILEGRSLLPYVRDQRVAPRRFAISEYDYAGDPARIRLGTTVPDSRMVMITDGRYKMIEVPGFRPMLYDQQTDPQELTDIGGDPAMAPVIARQNAGLYDWYRQARSRITVPDAWFSDDDRALSESDPTLRAGLIIGYWDEAELQDERARLACIDHQTGRDQKT
jgi:arylsulfatase A-like enzyme